MTTPPATTEVRDHLVAALEADLVGPFHPEDPEEVLPLPPSRWYLTGFLAPQEGRDLEAAEDPDNDDELAAGPDEDAEDAAGHEPEPKRKNVLPASMGLTVLLPPGSAEDEVEATLRYAEYRAEQESDELDRPRRVWRRQPRPPIRVALALDAERIRRGQNLSPAEGIWIGGRLDQVEAPGLEPGTRALSLFAVNRRTPRPGRQAEQFLFQVQLELACDRGFVPRPNLRDEHPDWDERVADLQYRHHFEHAVGHGTGVEVLADDDGRVCRVRTTWIPRAEVRRVVTREPDAVTTAMEELGALTDPAALAAALRPLTAAYGDWLASRRDVDPGTEPRRRTRDQLLHQAERARRRIDEGIDLVASDPQVRDAFCLANQAMAMQARQRSPERYDKGNLPRWRLFQLAFLLLNLPAIADDTHPDRDNVELIFFPTGGGKTEAYLGVIAFALLLRRLRGRDRPDRGLGVAVVLRYTLRLLTLDQLARAATLICALERLRQERPGELGEVRFAVGLWVGKTATANTIKEVAARIAEYRTSASPTAPSPFPLTHCPWCRAELRKDSLTLEPSRTQPTEVVVGCSNFRCEYAPARNPEGLPVLFVDEQIYRELPSFLVATVDKFAMLPWRGETGMLFGRVTHRQGRRFFGPLDRGQGEPLADGLRPPELIVQDELHLISGPLGTLVGLYETAIEALASRPEGETLRRPKILASTATVRRAREQVRALFARPELSVFPPPGVDAAETFFARVDHCSPGRLYVGLAAPGRTMKALLLRTYVALLAAAQHGYAARGGEDPTADAAMTLAGYFNSLRELGGMRRLVEDEVAARCRKIEDRRPRSDPGRRHPWFRNRKIQSEPVELTSRESAGRIKTSKARLNQPHCERDRVDVLLASNMISVGVDVDRLGLMVVAGQPRTTAEYIQASSRVGRQADRPGLVVTCFNVHKPRDRSQYEHFTAYHESFYRRVEAMSLTPFSAPALDRGLAGTLVAMARLAEPALTPPRGAMELADHDPVVRWAIAQLARRGGVQPGVGGAEGAVLDLESIARNLFDSWQALVAEATAGAARRAYSPFDRDRTAGRPLLFTPLDDDPPPRNTDDGKFAAPTSMRDVEPVVHLWLRRQELGGSG